MKMRKVGAGRGDGKTSRRTRNGYEKGVPFISKMIKWLKPTGKDMVKKSFICSTVKKQPQTFIYAILS